MSIHTAKLIEITERFIVDWRSRDDGSPFGRPAEPEEYFRPVTIEECDYPVAADVFAVWDRKGRRPFVELRTGLGMGAASSVISFPRTDAEDAEWCSFAFVLWPEGDRYGVTVAFATGEQPQGWGEQSAQ